MSVWKTWVSVINQSNKTVVITVLQLILTPRLINITLEILTENDLVIPNQNFEAAWSISMEGKQKTLLRNCSIKRRKTEIGAMHIGSDDIDFQQLHWKIYCQYW